MYREVYAWGFFYLIQNERKAMEIINEWFYGCSKWVVYGTTWLDGRREWSLLNLFDDKDNAVAYAKGRNRFFKGS